MPWIGTAIGSAVVAKIGAAVLQLAVSYAVGYAVNRAFGPKASDFSSDALRQGQIIRSPVEPHKVIYGEQIVSGTLVYATTTGSDDEYLHMVIALAGHEVDAISELYLEDTRWDDTRFQRAWKNTPVKAAVVNGEYIVSDTRYDDIPVGKELVVSGFSNAANNGTVTVSSVTRVRNGSFYEAAGENNRNDNNGYVVIAVNETLTNEGLVNKAYFKSRLAKWNAHLGTRYQAADADMVSDITYWTSNHRLRGIAYVYVRITSDPQLKAWPTGIPNITCKVRGKKVKDPRTTHDAGTAAVTNGSTSVTLSSTDFNGSDITAGWAVHINGETRQYNIASASGTAPNVTLTLEDEYTGSTDTGLSYVIIKREWSNNWALCVRDYLTDPQYGLGATPAEVDATYYEVDDTHTNASANTCETLVDNGSTVTFSVDGYTTGTVTSGNDYIVLNGNDHKGVIRPGNQIRIDADGTWYTIKRVVEKSEAVDVYSESTTVVVLTSNFSGTYSDSAITFNRTEYTYPCDGMLSTGNAPIENLRDLTGGMGDIVWSQGTFKILSHEYRTPTLSFDEDDLRGPVRLRATTPRKELFNQVSGVFKSAQDRGKPTNFTPVTSSTYQDEDGGLIDLDVDFPFTVTNYGAQRLSKMMLERARQGMIVELPMNYNGFQVDVGDVIQLSLDAFGWTNKTFRVLSWKAVESGGVDLTVQEESSTSYNHDPTEIFITDPSPDSGLPSPQDLDVVTNIAFDTTRFRSENLLRVTWDRPSNQTITRYYVQWRYFHVDEWQPVVEADYESIDIYGLRPGEIVIRVMAENVFDFTSDWTSAESLIDIASLYKVHGLEVFGQGNDNEFSGRNCPLSWRTTTAYGSELEGLGGWDQYLKDYQVEILAADFYDLGIERVVRTEYTTRPKWVYEWGENRWDFGTYRGREFLVRVRARAIDNSLSSQAAQIRCSNPAPGRPILYVSRQEIGSVSIGVISPNDDIDFSHVAIYRSTSTPVATTEANLVATHNGIDKNLINISSEPGTKYYYTAIAWDAFGPGTLTAGEVNATGLKVGQSDTSSDFGDWAFKTDAADATWISAHLQAGAVESTRIANLTAAKLTSGTIISTVAIITEGTFKAIDTVSNYEFKIGKHTISSTDYVASYGNASSSIYPLLMDTAGGIAFDTSGNSSGQRVEISSSDNEMHFYANDGTSVVELCTIGINTVGGDSTILWAGNLTNSNKVAIKGLSDSNYGIIGATNDTTKPGVLGSNSSSGAGIEGASSSGRGVTGSSTSGSGAYFNSGSDSPLNLNPRLTAAPTYTPAEGAGSFHVSTVSGTAKLYFYDGSSWVNIV